MNAERHSLYREIHKGIRAVLLGVVETAGRTDYTDPADVAALERAVDEAFFLLQSHADHEDRFVEPLVRAAAPDVARELDAAHDEQHGRIPALRALLSEIASGGPGRAAAGHAFSVALSRFAGELLVHMADEEEKAMTALQAALDDAALLQVHDAIVSSLGPEEKGLALRAMLPAINRAERVAMLDGMRRQVPPPVFDGILDLARRVLAPADARQLVHALGIAEAA
jgi:hypothetical protein